MKTALRLSCAALAAAVSLPAAPRARAVPSVPARPTVIEVTAKKFGFSPAAIRLRKGEPVTFRLTTLDVRHGFFSRPLGIDAEFAPGAPRDVTITPRESGRFVVICDRFCGSGHGEMKMAVDVE